MSTNAPIYQTITQFADGDATSASVMNHPITDTITNIQAIISYLTADGAGSGIDSDLLDGQHGAYYLNAGNMNAGTLPGAQFNDTSHGNRSGGALHAVATESVAGFLSAADKTKLDGIATSANNYTLPIASGVALGGIKIGARLTIAGDGTLSADNQTFTLPVATTVVLGGVKQGSLVTIAGDGTLSANVQSDNNFTTTLLSKLNGIAANANLYVLPAATTSVLGGVIVTGSYLAVDGSGNLSLTTTNLALLNASNTFSQDQFAPHFVSGSDRELKTNIETLSGDKYDFSKLNLYSWDWNETAPYVGHAVGTMADEMAAICPEACAFDENGRAIGIDYARAAFLLAMYLKAKMGA